MGGEWPAEHTTTPAPPDYDLFHAQILIEELGRPSSEIASVILTGMIIGLRSVMQFGLRGGPELTREVVSDCLAGNNNICLCMSEPYAGSDVAGLTASAVLSADGTHYVLNGKQAAKPFFSSQHLTRLYNAGRSQRAQLEPASDCCLIPTHRKRHSNSPLNLGLVVTGEKKWITGGVHSEYFNVACRTEGEGAEGLTMMLVRRSLAFTEPSSESQTVP
jgi:alkylation response protein AidB-like acyl-CoA dehydrogenase